MADATRYVLSVMCEDRVGLVSRLACAVERLHGNIEELHQGVVQGYFVLNFMATFPEAATAEAVTRSLEAAGEGREVVVSALPRREAGPPPAAEGTAFLLTVTGCDAPGILGKLTASLADRGINIEDLTSLSDDGRFTITARLTVPAGADIATIRLDLAEILGDAGAEVALMHEDIFRATSRVDPR